MNEVFKSASPSYPLSLFIKQFWMIESCLQKDSVHIQRIVPNGLMELTFYSGKRPESLDKNKKYEDNILICGQQKGFYDIVIAGKLSIFSVMFRPYGAKVFFNIPSSEFFDKSIPLKYIIKDNIFELENSIHEAESFERKIIAAENFLLQLLKKNIKEYELNRIINSINSITGRKGQISIETLISNAYLSRKQFERTFSEYIGISPAQFLKIIRFQNSLNERSLNNETSLTKLAYKCGYYDQSHMIRDYKQFSGITPLEYFAECEPISDYFL
ncbi:MAG: helix-turn-helix domain-containing protein [Bacteroidales bacterium]|jgi:AraC-like DNA-binding protein|nr:helix-turn-helix domain-containing protein [Bacteroidales bacterium]